MSLYTIKTLSDNPQRNRPSRGVLVLFTIILKYKLYLLDIYDK